MGDGFISCAGSEYCALSSASVGHSSHSPRCLSSKPALATSRLLSNPVGSHPLKRCADFRFPCHGRLQHPFCCSHLSSQESSVEGSPQYKTEKGSLYYPGRWKGFVSTPRHPDFSNHKMHRHKKDLL